MCSFKPSKASMKVYSAVMFPSTIDPLYLFPAQVMLKRTIFGHLKFIDRAWLVKDDLDKIHIFIKVSGLLKTLMMEWVLLMSQWDT